MIAKLILILITLLPQPTIHGHASQYSPGVMAATIQARQAGRTSYHLPQRLPDVDGFVAVRDAWRIGSIVWLRPVGGRWERFLVADCAGIADGGRAWMDSTGVVVEVDYATAERWDTVGRGVRVELSWSEPVFGEIREGLD